MSIYILENRCRCISRVKESIGIQPEAQDQKLAFLRRETQLKNNNFKEYFKNK
jgi:hypothetical protein